MSIITFCRELGSFGTEIAEKTAKILNYKCLDKDYIKKSLIKYGFSEKIINKFNEKNLSLLDVLFTNKEKYSHFMKMIICDFAKENNSIILGMGSQLFFKNVPGILHVRIFAPLEKRLERIKNLYSCDDNKARIILKDNDHSRNGIYKFFFNLNLEDSHLYDLIINTDKISVDNAISLLKSAITEIEKKEDKKNTSNFIKNLLLEQKIAIKILYEKNIPIRNLNVKAIDGTIELSGIIGHSDHKVQCESIAREIDEVKDIKNNIILHISSSV